jgi:Mce-associated membrane protein
VTTTPSPTWYDLLGVAPDASADEIRAAWRGQIADLDPTDRRFAALNHAAEVLLDPARRASYDAEIAPPAAAEPAPEPEHDPSDAAAAAPVAAAGSASPARAAVVPGWLLAAVGLLTLAVVAVTAYLWVTEPSADTVESDARAAQAAAERAVVPILSYDAKDIDRSKAAADQYLTGDYRKEYDRVFTGIIEKNAPATGTVVNADLVRSSVVRSGEDRVQVFALVNQTRTNKRFTQPQVYKNWVTITMEKVDGTWLVADLKT